MNSRPPLIAPFATHEMELTVTGTFGAAAVQK